MSAVIVAVVVALLFPEGLADEAAVWRARFDQAQRAWAACVEAMETGIGADVACGAFDRLVREYQEAWEASPLSELSSEERARLLWPPQR